MTTIYLIRHAEAEGNLYRIAHGQYDSILTDRGLAQVEALRQRFADIPVDAVYSSDLRRACQTAAALFVPKGLPLQKRRDLREVSMGVWEQKTWGEIEQDEPEALTRFTRQLDRWQVEGSETAAIVRDRMLAALRDIAAQNPGKTVAAFSHGAALRILLGTLQGFSLEQLGETPHGDNTAVSRIEAEGDSLRVVYRDDNSHVAKNLSTFAAQTWWKHENAIEPGLYFRPLALPEQQDWLVSCGEEGILTRKFDRQLLLDEAERRTTLCAWLEGIPIGILQLHPEKEAESGNGWISFYYMTPESRDHGYGIQLLGQAVRLYRPMGRKRLRIAMSHAHLQAQPFFERYGFHTVDGQTDAGRTIWEKNIALDGE